MVIFSHFSNFQTFSYHFCKTTFYSVGFFGPKDLRKDRVTINEIEISFIGPAIADISHYEITFQGMMANGTLTLKKNATVRAMHDYTRIPASNTAALSNFGSLDFNERMSSLENDDAFSAVASSMPRESAIMSDLTPGMLYAVEIRTLRRGMTEQIRSQPTLDYFRTLPGVPNEVKLAKVQTNSTTFIFQPPVGIFSGYEATHTLISTNETSLTKYLGTTAQEMKTVKLKPGALYRFNITVFSKEGSNIDATRNTYTVNARTIPNSPSYATAASTMGTIHLKWRAPANMEETSDWQYRIVYGITRPDGETDEPDETFKELVKWVPSANGAPTREDFLSQLKSGRLYEIKIYTVAGKRNEETIQISRPLGPLRTVTQPEQPKFTSTYQLTTKHMKVTWRAPKGEGGRFDHYLLRVNRRPESGATGGF